MDREGPGPREDLADVTPTRDTGTGTQPTGLTGRVPVHSTEEGGGGSGEGEVTVSETPRTPGPNKGPVGGVSVVPSL